MEKDHLLAGEFGAAARLSPKALRLYAEQGILVPASVDPVTGYRYYAPGQLPRARLIGRLRALGLPLARIGSLADLDPGDRELELRGWLRRERELLDERAAVIEAVRGSAEDAALVAAVAVRDVPATKVLCRSRRIGSAALPDLIGAAERDIREQLRASGLPGDGARLVFFQELVTPDSDGIVEVAVAYDGSVEPIGDLHIRLVPAHTEAYLPVPPGFEDLPLVLRVYDAVEAWTDARPGVTCTGHPYEIYPGTRARFDVAYPISN
ncbi:DNA-binding transcriptional MerR regulator [Allocatelliglobosispora scoriae]|uniref:DNA-binding transcriptional MerR regulator n=1 Tax=Allocatelliglobosispora scoriae TaxID=643052 RepID=A0A841BZ33_9ACTN|nr:MerR family transcriptional regulator [Allocatelliglobosispora scoriae]MBB5874397.1 DNA-binding transcriptional MerR regulator [Allocatelliglobosispora scoriae]